MSHSCVYTKSLQWYPTLCNAMDYSLRGSSVNGILQARILGVTCHFCLQGLFLTQGSNPCLLHFLHWQVDSLLLSHRGSLESFIQVVIYMITHDCMLGNPCYEFSLCFWLNPITMLITQYCNCLPAPLHYKLSEGGTLSFFFLYLIHKSSIVCNPLWELRVNSQNEVDNSF